MRQSYKDIDNNFFLNSIPVKYAYLLKTAGFESIEDVERLTRSQFKIKIQQVLKNRELNNRDLLPEKIADYLTEEGIEFFKIEDAPEEYLSDYQIWQTADFYENDEQEIPDSILTEKVDEILNTFGTDILADTRRIAAIFADYFPEQKGFTRQVVTLLTDNYHVHLEKETRPNNKDEYKRYVEKQLKYLENNYGFSKSFGRGIFHVFEIISRRLRVDYAWTRMLQEGVNSSKEDKQIVFEEIIHNEWKNCNSKSIYEVQKIIESIECLFPDNDFAVIYLFKWISHSDNLVNFADFFESRRECDYYKINGSPLDGDMFADACWLVYSDHQKESDLLNFPKIFQKVHRRWPEFGGVYDNMRRLYLILRICGYGIERSLTLATEDLKILCERNTDFAVDCKADIVSLWILLSKNGKLGDKTILGSEGTSRKLYEYIKRKELLASVPKIDISYSYEGLIVRAIYNEINQNNRDFITYYDFNGVDDKKALSFSNMSISGETISELLKAGYKNIKDLNLASVDDIKLKLGINDKEVTDLQRQFRNYYEKITWKKLISN